MFVRLFAEIIDFKANSLSFGCSRLGFAGCCTVNDLELSYLIAEFLSTRFGSPRFRSNMFESLFEVMK